MGATWLTGSGVPNTDHQEAVTEVHGSLFSAYSFGTVVVGKPGVGKSSLLHEVLEKLGADTRVVHLRGTALSRDKPFSALAFLLGELGISTERGSESVAKSLTRYFDAAAGGLTVVVVDNADNLDAESADIVAELALNRSVKLLVACRDLARCPASLMTLWLEGALLRIDLDRLLLSEADALLTQTLQGKLSRRAVHALWEHSAGNARLMQLLANDFVLSGKIIRQGDIFVLGCGQFRVSQPTADAVLAHLGPLTDQQMGLLEMLALAAHMPLAMVSTLADVEDLDHLHAIGAIDFALDEQLVRTDPLVAVVVRERVGPFRRIDHLQKVEEAHTGTGAPPIHPVRYAEWSLECGLSLDVEAASQAASVANEQHDPETALRIITSINDVDSNLPLLLETVKAHLGVEDEASAAHVMQSFITKARETFTSAELKRLEAPENRSTRVQLEVARSILADQEYPAGAPAPSGDDDVLLARAERATDEGRYDLVQSMMTERQGLAGTGSPEIEVQLDGLRALAYAITDKQHEALSLKESIRLASPSLQLPEQIRARLAFRLELISLITGEDSDSSGSPTHPYSLSGDGTAGELMEGVKLAHHGHAEEALVLLVPSFAQLRVWDPVGLQNVCAAAMAYCYSLQGDLAKVRPLMLPLTGEGHMPGAGLPLFAMNYFKALALALLGSTTEAIAELRSLATAESKSEHFGLELLARAALLRLGAKSAAPSLRTVADRTQGPFSELCSLFAGGMAEKDPELLLKAVEMAESMGHGLFAAAITDSARSMAVASGDRTLTRQVQRIISSSAAHREGNDVRKQLDLLTPREEEVARLAKAGFSNKEMAARMHVSVRTVEGHLYQIYVKLGVNSRIDLFSVLEGEGS